MEECGQAYQCGIEVASAAMCSAPQLSHRRGWGKGCCLGGWGGLHSSPGAEGKKKSGCGGNLWFS